MNSSLPRALVDDMRKKQIDVEMTLRILENYNQGRYDHIKPVEVESIPAVDGQTIIDMTKPVLLRLDRRKIEERLESLGVSWLISGHPEIFGRTDGDSTLLDRGALKVVGNALLPLLSYGILNGGSATSYADRTKNRSFNSELYSLLEPEFERMAELSSGRAKGLTPGFINPDGSPGPSFIELKMRALLIEAMAARNLSGTYPSASLSADTARSKTHSETSSAALSAGLPLFQMTSVSNDREVIDAFAAFSESPLLAPLIRATGFDPTKAETGVQSLIAAYSHSSEGRPKRIFDRASGIEGSTLPLPGGHGQNFSVLKSVYRNLRRMGKRYVYLGNVDNLGFTVDPVELAYLALTGRQAGFDFAFRTPVDVKGGILVRDRHSGLTCADIGPAISTEEMLNAEASGSGILFNCATGLFDLDYLMANIDRIVDEIPTRFSDQSKDAGNYSQAEQVTWEIIGMLDNFLVFGVKKWNRFLAAKLLVETLMTSGVKIDHPDYPRSARAAEDLHGTAERLHAGLVGRLENVYGMQLNAGRWQPVPPEALGKGQRNET
ncbi:MAG TPA: UTP--glucose-1-phosphate uridylyltransferase [Spirochaetia bacterium]|nr:UTP--glucose-1-phosphate uridylyltransferase [Spirochaetia bacterium]